jgi:hypothetical protein
VTNATQQCVSIALFFPFLSLPPRLDKNQNKCRRTHNHPHRPAIARHSDYKGDDGLKYTLPMSFMPKLDQINSTITNPFDRYNVVMALSGLFTIEPVK